MVLFCCNVGGSDLKLKAQYKPSNGLYKKSYFISGNEVIKNGYIKQTLASI